MNLFEKIQDWIKNLSMDKPSHQTHDKEFWVDFARMIGHTRNTELSCDEVYQLLDIYAEMSIRGEDTGHLMPLIKHHLEMCKDCLEEFDTLKNMLELSSV